MSFNKNNQKVSLDSQADCLEKREKFAISLRNVKRQNVLDKRRIQLGTKGKVFIQKIN